MRVTVAPDQIRSAFEAVKDDPRSTRAAGSGSAVGRATETGRRYYVETLNVNLRC